MRARAQGDGLKEIAERMSLSVTRVHQLYSEGMEYLTEELALQAAKIRVMEVERLEGLIQELLQHRKTNIVAVKEGGDPVVIEGYPNLEIYDRIFKAIGQKGKMLGLEIIAREQIPDKSEVEAPWRQLLADVITINEDFEGPKELEAAHADVQD